MVRLLITCLTPLTFLATFSARVLALGSSTWPLSVTTPFFTSTFKPPPFTSWSLESRMATWSEIVLSLSGSDLARQAPAIKNAEQSSAQIFAFICFRPLYARRRHRERSSRGSGGLVQPGGRFT